MGRMGMVFIRPTKTANHGCCDNVNIGALTIYRNFNEISAKRHSFDTHRLAIIKHGRNIPPSSPSPPHPSALDRHVLSLYPQLPGLHK